MAAVAQVESYGFMTEWHDPQADILRYYTLTLFVQPPGSSAPNIGFEHSDAPASAERGHPCPVKAAQMRSHRTITHNRAASPPVPVHPAPAFRLFELPVRSLACLRLDVPPR